MKNVENFFKKYWYICPVALLADIDGTIDLLQRINSKQISMHFISEIFSHLFSVITPAIAVYLLVFHLKMARKQENDIVFLKRICSFLIQRLDKHPSVNISATKTFGAGFSDHIKAYYSNNMSKEKTPDEINSDLNRFKEDIFFNK